MITKFNQPKIFINEKGYKTQNSDNKRIQTGLYEKSLIRLEKNKIDDNSLTFKGGQTALLTGLRGLNNSPAVGACAVDLCSMVIPRTTIEFKNRGPQSGIEAFFREVSSCLIHACVGLIGLGAATAISSKFNKDYGVKAQNIFASGDTIKNMSAIWENSANSSHKFFEGFLSSIKGLNGEEWRTVSKEANEKIVENMVNLAAKSKELTGKTGIDKINLLKEVKDLKQLVVSQIVQDTGASVSYRIKASEGIKGVSSSLSELVDNAVVLSNSFKTKTEEKLPGFVKALIKNKTTATMIGLGICAALCVSIQPLNRYLTKKRTGHDGFVGVKDKNSDQSKGFKALKTAFGIGFPAFAISTIGKLSDFTSNVQFNSKIPTLNQFKLLYGLTIGSRFLAARNKDELRESVIKDTLGFTNWLILGGMVSKLTARALGGKELINNPVAKEGGKKGLGYAFKWLTKSSVKSFDEVLLPNVKEIAKDGKMLKFSDMFKNADNATKSKILKIAGSQIAGYLYSGLVLGIGIAKLNIFITKKLEAKRKANNINNSENLYDVDYFEQVKGELSSVFKDFN